MYIKLKSNTHIKCTCACVFHFGSLFFTTNDRKKQQNSLKKCAHTRRYIYTFPKCKQSTLTMLLIFLQLCCCTKFCCLSTDSGFNSRAKQTIFFHWNFKRVQLNSRVFLLFNLKTPFFKRRKKKFRAICSSCGLC